MQSGDVSRPLRAAVFLVVRFDKPRDYMWFLRRASNLWHSA